MGLGIMDPRVSIIIPTYGTRGGGLERAILSASSQDYPDCEVIVVDDATPGEGVAQEVARHPGVRYVRRRTNGGVAAAQNTGIDRSQGQLICFLHSDDEYPPSRISSQLAAWDGSSVVGGRSLVGEVPAEDPLPRATPDDFLWHRFGAHSSPYLFPIVVLRETPFDAVLRSWEDWDLLLRLRLDGVEFLPLESTTVQIHEEASDRLSVSEAMATALKYLYEKHRALIAVDRQLQALWEFKIGRLLMRVGVPNEGRRWLGSSLRMDPLHPKRIWWMLRVSLPRKPS